MVSQRFKDALLSVYHGEQFGEAFFESLLPYSENDEQRFIVGSLLQLESEGKAVMRPVLAKLQLALDEDSGSRPRGEAAVLAMKEMSWREKYSAIASGIRAKGLPQYEELATLVSAEEDREAYALADFMGRHERAVLTVAENIATDQRYPVEPVIELLHFPLSRPVS